MKQTTRLIDVIQSELINQGQNEFYNKINNIDQLTYWMPEFQFIRKIMKYDDTVKQILDWMIYNGITLDDKDADLFFKQSFLNKFYARQIGQETIELFAGQVTYYLITHETYISNLYQNYAKFMNAGTSSNASDNDTNGTNMGVADLPQDRETLDLTSNTMNYANTNTVNRGFNKKTSNGTTETFSPSNLNSIRQAWDDMFKEIDRLCFLQVF